MSECECHLWMDQIDSETAKWEVVMSIPESQQILDGHAFGRFGDVLHVELLRRPQGMRDDLALRVLVAVYQYMDARLRECDEYVDRGVDLRQWLGQMLSPTDARSAEQLLLTPAANLVE